MLSLAPLLLGLAGQPSTPSMTALAAPDRSGAAVGALDGAPDAALDAALDGADRGCRESVIRVRPRDLRDLRTTLALTDDVWSHAMRNGEIDVRVSCAARRSLEAAGVPIEVLIPDVQGMIAAQAAARAARAQAAGQGGQGGIAGEDWYGDVKDLAAINAKLDEWIAAHPALVSDVLVGMSLENRPIRGIRISSTPPGSNVPAFLFDACQHAREWATPMTAMFLAERLIEGAGDPGTPDIAAILASSEVIIVPVVNPDGYQFSWDDTRLWRKNRRSNGGGSYGVDLNRNWGFQWGGEGASSNPNDETYRGPSAFSEPETQAMRDFVEANGRIIGNIDIHSYSQLILWPWGWTADYCDAQPLFFDLGESMASAIASVHGRSYDPGPIYTNIYPASGGSCDWLFGSAGVFATSIEVRDTGSYGFLIPPEEVRPCAEENTAGAIALIKKLLAPGYMALAAPLPSAATPEAPTLVTVYATALASDFASPPQLVARIGTDGVFAGSELTPLGNGLYEGTLPAAPCGAVIDFYFAWSGASDVVALPADGPAGLFSIPVSASEVVASDTFEAASGWTVGAPGDNATSGQWVRVDPNGTTAQPEQDHTAAGTMCWVTGQGPPGGQAGTADVDNGVTTITSALLDGSDPESTLHYWRWYSNDLGASPGEDSMLVQYSLDGLAWHALETVSESETAWVEASFPIGDFVQPPGSFRIRFVARDLGAGSLVEAAIDDVSILAPACAGSPADLNSDGLVDGADLVAVLGLWGPCAGCAADLTGDDVIDGADITVILGEWS